MADLMGVAVGDDVAVVFPDRVERRRVVRATGKGSRGIVAVDLSGPVVVRFRRKDGTAIARDWLAWGFPKSRLPRVLPWSDSLPAYCAGERLVARLRELTVSDLFALPKEMRTRLAEAVGHLAILEGGA